MPGLVCYPAIMGNSIVYLVIAALHDFSSCAFTWINHGQVSPVGTNIVVATTSYYSAYSTA